METRSKVSEVITTESTHSEETPKRTKVVKAKRLQGDKGQVVESTSSTAILPPNISVKRFDMPEYQPWTTHVDILACGQWMIGKHLLAWCNNARLIDFSLNEPRKQALANLNSLSTECPFSKDKRFPEMGLNVDVDFGDWPRKLQQVRNALSYKEPKGVDRGGQSSDFNDSLLSFTNGVTAIVAQIRRKDGVWDRRSFESYHDLTFA